jgi:hypothetical protein
MGNRHELMVLVISGSMGSGKTTVLAEASDLLTIADIHHAAIDLDHLSIGHFPGTAPVDLPFYNLVTIWSNYAALGIERLILSEAIDSDAKLERLKRAMPKSQIIVCRLMAELGIMQQRVRLREPGLLQEQLVARVAELEKSLDASHLEDFSVENNNRSVTEVAREVLLRAHWL